MLSSKVRRPSLYLLIIVATVLFFFQRFRDPEYLESDHHAHSLDTDEFDLVPETKSQPVKSKPRPILGKHKFRPDGLLEVNMEGAHPIFELISRAEKEWEEKLRRASRTFTEVVQEYERRYKRAPPKGFDLW